MPGVFPDYPAPVVRIAGAEREPAGNQNTDAAPREDGSAPSLSTEQELAGAPQLSSMLNDDLRCRTQPRLQTRGIGREEGEARGHTG